MKKNILLSLMMALVSAVVLSLVACNNDSDDNTKDTTKPTILTTGSEASVVNPINCQLYQRGDTIHFFYVFEDDVELGNFNIEIHDNSDHHSHSTESDDHDHDHEGGECSHDDEHEHDADEHHHETEKHWVYNQDFQIPAGQRRYEARVDIPIPTDIAKGDYHFMIRVTDRAGWMQMKAIAIIVEE